MNDIQEAIGQINTTPTTVIERARVDYETLSDQIAKAEAHIEHNDSIVENARRAISQAHQNNREQREFIRISKKRQRVMRRTAHDLENINLGL
jgi:hypothetical protein